MAKVSPSDCDHIGGEKGRICGTKPSAKSTLTGGGPTSCYMSTQPTAIKRLGSRVDGRPEQWKELDESSRDANHNEGSDYFKETKDDPFNRSFWRALLEDGFTRIIVACVVFAGGVTISLILHIYIGGLSIFEVVGPRVVLADSQVCASLGLEVLMDGGSSVDAAITAALCQGIVHPHTSGIGGGGVMLIYDGLTGKHTVIDFGETAPSRIKEEMLQHDLQEKPGLLVGVPGMLRGLHEAHQLYGRMQLAKIVRRAASIAREGFNVSHSLAEAIESHRGKKASKLFREIFSPEEDDQHHPAPSTLMRLPHLASVLERIASHGVEAFYQGNVSEEIAVTVQAHGGVLSRADLANYSAVLQEPLMVTFKGHQVFVPPPPSTAGVLLTFLNIMDGIKLTGKIGEHSASHWIVESLIAALLMAPGIADPKFVSSVSDTVSKMTSKTHAAALRQMIRNSSSEPLLLHRRVSALRSLPEGAGTSSQVLVMGADDLIVSLSCSLNGLFGSGIITPSGILLNSQIMNFSWRNKGTQNATWSDQPNRIEAGKRARSWHVPTVVRQTGERCGQTVVLGATAGQQALSGMAQVLIKLLSLHKNLTDSVSEGRLHSSMQTNVTLVDLSSRFERCGAWAMLSDAWGTCAWCRQWSAEVT
ncbi:glutathione hydrolase 7-like isoform X2 [Engraulis encrasicolus]|uniref:glutathione hydrolase 7-like isoform X2 n=1 Tax=Engraulis encrasicolus TaxID=184585 RepID=UPI002FD597F5